MRGGGRRGGVRVAGCSGFFYRAEERRRLAIDGVTTA
jgi:hypothetical protein